MATESEHAIRRAGVEDAPAIGQLLHDFNAEFDEPTPDAAWLIDRLRLLLGQGDVTVLLAGEGPDGLAVLSFRPSLWSSALECYVAELYVVPGRRGEGRGRALMEAVIELARAEGAGHVELNTGEDDVAARGLYESLGFDRRGGRPDGPQQYYYEREL